VGHHLRRDWAMSYAIGVLESIWFSSRFRRSVFVIAQWSVLSFGSMIEILMNKSLSNK
jgi:hypothetical protein